MSLVHLINPAQAVVSNKSKHVSDLGPTDVSRLYSLEWRERILISSGSSEMSAIKAAVFAQNPALQIVLQIPPSE